jgi:hypothetical protein
MNSAPKYLACGIPPIAGGYSLRYIAGCFQGLFRKKLPDYRGALIAFELRVMLDIDSVGAAHHVER